MKTKETRSFELRADAAEGVLVGRAIAYNTLSSPMPSPEKGVMFREKVKPGAFTKSLASGDQTADFNHDSMSLPLGRKSAGTLKLVDSDGGLDFRIQLDPRQQAHRELYSAVKRGDVKSCSWAFTPDDGGEEWSEDTEQRGQFIRTLTSCKLFAISIVNNPAYPVGTSVSARAVESEDAQLKRQVEAVGERIALHAKLESFMQKVIYQRPALRQGGAMEVCGDGGQSSVPTGDSSNTLRCKATSPRSSASEHRKAAAAHRCYRDRAKTSDDYAFEDTAASNHDAAASGDSDAAQRCTQNCSKRRR